MQNAAVQKIRGDGLPPPQSYSDRKLHKVFLVYATTMMRLDLQLRFQTHARATCDILHNIFLDTRAICYFFLTSHTIKFTSSSSARRSLGAVFEPGVIRKNPEVEHSCTRPSRSPLSPPCCCERQCCRCCVMACSPMTPSPHPGTLDIPVFPKPRPLPCFPLPSALSTQIPTT